MSHDCAAELIEILQAENAALRAGDAVGAAALLARKQAAAATFAAAHRRGRAPPPHGVVRQLNDLADENKALLERAIAVQGRVIETLARAIPAALARNTATAPRYDARGTLAQRPATAWTLRGRA